VKLVLLAVCVYLCDDLRVEESSVWKLLLVDVWWASSAAWLAQHRLVAVLGRCMLLLTTTTLLLVWQVVLMLAELTWAALLVLRVGWSTTLLSGTRSSRCWAFDTRVRLRALSSSRYRLRRLLWVCCRRWLSCYSSQVSQRFGWCRLCLTLGLLLVAHKHIREVKRQKDWSFRTVIRSKDLDFCDSDACLMMLSCCQQATRFHTILTRHKCIIFTCLFVQVIGCT